ncbi:MAG: glycoside hydrolase family 20 zincin-like fold domain-containing protein [Kiritimatiellae bacterium]|nr:glycoside hydrolase family 20 zincin-like fold domain-containing protein [Kiritimatiellia bacterium]
MKDSNVCTRVLCRLIIALVCALALGHIGFAQVVKISPGEEAQWLRHVMPLPHEISIPEKAVMNCADIKIRTRPEASDLEKSAASELAGLFQAKTGSIPNGKDFEIMVGVIDKDGRLCGHEVKAFAKIRALPNSDQAYVIQPVENRRLLLAGLNGKGVYYAAVTLRALLEPVTTQSKTEIPLMTVLDWPDMAERGLWNSSANEIVYDLATLKLNYSRIETLLQVASNKNSASIPQKDLMIKGRLRAINYVPNITHLNFLHRYDLFKVYPGLMGKGDSAFAGQYQAHGGAAKEHPVPCASNPLLAKILADWMKAIAADGATECGCWLTERPAQCGCAKCMAEGQFVQEARAFIAAWRETQKQYPAFIIRLFISTTTDEKYERIMAELPPGVKIERACALGLERVRGEPRDRFVNPLLDPYAAKGVWIASYDVPIGVNGKVDTPEFKLPESSAQRIHDFLLQMGKRKYSGVYGMLAFTESEKVCAFNMAALAEWSWNLNGRSEREFAAAWAARAGYANPDRVADWSELMGPVEFDVYDSGFPECYAWGQAVALIKNRQKPELGKGMFRYYADKNSFDVKISSCQEAQEIAKGFKDPYLADETAVVLSYIKLAQCVYALAERVSAGADKSKLGGELARLKQAGDENGAAIRKWQTGIGPEPWHHRTHKAIKATENTVAEITAALGK